MWPSKRTPATGVEDRAQLENRAVFDYACQRELPGASERSSSRVDNIFEKQFWRCWTETFITPPLLRIMASCQSHCCAASAQSVTNIRLSGDGHAPARRTAVLAAGSHTPPPVHRSRVLVVLQNRVRKYASGSKKVVSPTSPFMVRAPPVRWTEPDPAGSLPFRDADRPTQEIAGSPDDGGVWNVNRQLGERLRNGRCPPTSVVRFKTPQDTLWGVAWG
ncbi:putative Serine protease [Anopheles sinensis]|uniref:Putative Serine protease n=1 Tax=Anopheles sinensis TaxID=74873 RepID=A0A084VGX0_ANOSI|nr:putative Serine protease [Anopheles sinensis]